MEYLRNGVQFCWCWIKERCKDLWYWLTWFTTSLLDLCGLTSFSESEAVGKSCDIERAVATGGVTSELRSDHFTRMGDSVKKVAGGGGTGTQVHKVCSCDFFCALHEQNLRNLKFGSLRGS